MSFNNQFNNDKSFDRLFNMFPFFVLLVFLLMAGAFAFNAYQYVNRPECNDGFLIQDDSGVYRCLDKSDPIIVRTNNNSYRNNTGIDIGR